MEPRPQRETHLLEYWHILRKRRWVVLTALAVMVTTVTIGSFLVTPSYRSTAVLQIERDNPNIVNFREIYAPDNSYLAYSDFYQTQYRLIESRDVLRRVVERLDLPRHPAMAAAARPGLLGRLRDLARDLLPAGEADDTAAARDPLQPWVATLRGGLRVSPVKNTHLVEVSYVSTDPDLAAAAANAVADEYIHFNTEIKSRTTGLAGVKLDEEIRTLTGDIEALDAQIRELRTGRSIVELGNQKNLELASLEEYTRAANQARIARSRSQAAYESLQAADPDSLPEVQSSAVVRELKSRLGDLERQAAEKGELFKPDYPEMVALRSQIDVARQQLSDEIGRIRRQVVGAAETAYRTARGEEERLARLEEQQKQQVRELESSLAEYDTLKAALEAKKEMRAGLVKRRDETGVLGRIEEKQAGNVWLVEEAQPPTAPFRPDKRLNILLSLVAGLGLGIGLAFFFEYLDNSVKSGEDLERHVGVPALGLIPTLRRRGAGKVVALDSGGRPVDIEMVSHSLPKSQHAEAYRDLRTTLLLSSPDRPPRILMVTSAQPREGKTVTSVNVATSLTQIGKRVLLLDADMRKPRIHKVLNLSRQQGLSTCLAGSAGWLDLVEETPVPGLWAMTAGPIPPNPAELLASHSFADILDELRRGERFDHVVVDTPPVLAVADPVIVAERADGVLLVIKGGETPRQSVAGAVEKLRGGKARLLGAVLNNIDLSGHGYYAYRHGYRYGYAQGAGEDAVAGDDRAAGTGTGGRA